MFKGYIIKIILFIFLNITIYANTCLNCHPNFTANKHFKKHYTMQNSINITRKIWGIKDSNVTLQTLPKSKKNNINKVSDLVDDFLRRKCLSCHLTSKNINSSNNECLACHNNHTNKKDSFIAKTSMSKCIKCHKNEFIGTDYMGLFPHDFDKSYRSPITPNGNYPDKSSGIDYHHLSEDIHYKKGLSCIDCHKSKDFEKQITCTSCHNNLSKQNHQNYHNKLSCNSCHSSWNISSYELNVLRDDTPSYKQWKRLIVQDDIYLERFLTKALILNKQGKIISPKMPDYLTNKLEDGIWYSGYRYRRWENNFLVNNLDGKIKLAKPMFTYRISYKNKDGKVIFNDITKDKNNNKIEGFLPKSPHTIIKNSKSCEMCHNNKIFFDKHLIDKNVLQGKVLKGSMLTKEQLEKLNSYFYKIQRSKILFN